jgi:hypothetical protein
MFRLSGKVVIRNDFFLPSGSTLTGTSVFCKISRYEFNPIFLSIG